MFVLAKRRRVTDTEGNSLLSLPAPIFNSTLLINLSRVCWVYTGKERLELRSSSILWRADSHGVIGNEKRKNLCRFQPDLLGA